MLLVFGLVIPFAIALFYGVVAGRALDRGIRAVALKTGGALIFLLPLLVLWHSTWLFALGGSDGLSTVVMVIGYWTVMSAIAWAPGLLGGMLWSQWWVNRG